MIEIRSFLPELDTFAQVIGIFVAAAMVVVTNRHNAKLANKTARQEIYQSLELAAVKLFRFECTHSEITSLLWLPDRSKATEVNTEFDELKEYQLVQYLCQLLSLFEIACRFRRQELMDPEVFGSWVIWFWELTTETAFQRSWAGPNGIQWHYVPEFREIMNAGIYFATSGAETSAAEDSKRAFFKYVAHAFEDKDHIENWLNRPTSDFDSKYFDRS